MARPYGNFRFVFIIRWWCVYDSRRPIGGDQHSATARRPTKNLWLFYSSIVKIYVSIVTYTKETLCAHEEKSRFSLDELITCGANQSTEDAKRREMHWIEIATIIDQPLLIKNGTAVKKWTLYNSFFVAMTVASTIGMPHFTVDSPPEIEPEHFNHIRFYLT